MDNGINDRVWDHDVQEFIVACQHEKLHDIELGFSTFRGSEESFLNVSAVYLTRHGHWKPIGYRWVDSSKRGLMPEVYLGGITAPAAQNAKHYLRAALRAGLWRERKSVAYALLAVTTLYFKALAVRDRMQVQHLQSVKDDLEFKLALLKGGLDEGPDSAPRDPRLQWDRGLAFRTLNDLASLYGKHSPANRGSLPGI